VQLLNLSPVLDHVHFTKYKSFTLLVWFSEEIVALHRL
jgi:hypothetical protein